ncbi:hypothetical protein SLEP1_g48046 [Rubroshorea leprosula]|uniref:Uncharacterized protein n=1 Tax=Rubroshorea leprosula TaxID=152421 RepID=A0AAV5LT89_9ROSI|nr:hypothetical protein SLEP1_g48046 [Rubroshorea leprosula]
MSSYGYMYKGYSSTQNGVGSCAYDWNNSICSSSSDDVCWPVLVDAEGREMLVISYDIPNNNGGYYVSETETTVRTYGSTADEEAWSRPSSLVQRPVEDKWHPHTELVNGFPKKVNELTNKVLPRSAVPSPYHSSPLVSEYKNSSKTKVEPLGTSNGPAVKNLGRPSSNVERSTVEKNLGRPSSTLEARLRNLEGKELGRSAGSAKGKPKIEAYDKDRKKATGGLITAAKTYNPAADSTLAQTAVQKEKAEAEPPQTMEIEVPVTGEEKKEKKKKKKNAVKETDGNEPESEEPTTEKKSKKEKKEKKHLAENVDTLENGEKKKKRKHEEQDEETNMHDKKKEKKKKKKSQ